MQQTDLVIRRDSRTDNQPGADWLETVTCLSKVPLTRGEARDWVRKRQARGQKTQRGPNVTAYRCPYAAHWHVGHNTSGAERRRMQRERREAQGE